MSRVCVKNIPNYLTEDRLREHFAAKGQVTDVKIIRTKDGRSRQFAFVGYRTEEEAESAIKYFNRSFIDTSRLTCEIALPIGDQSDYRPWSRYSKGSSANNKLNKHHSDNDESPEKGKPKTASTKNSDDANEDPKLAEFLQVMQPRSKTKIWANDDVTEAAESLAGKKTKSASKKKDEHKKNSADNKKSGHSLEKDEGKDKSKGNSKVLLNSMDVSSDDSTDEEESSDEEEGNIEHEQQTDNNLVDKDMSIQPGNSVRDEAISDLDYLKQRVRKDWSDEEDDMSESSSDSSSDSESSDSEDSSSSSDEDSEENNGTNVHPEDDDDTEHNDTNQSSDLKEVLADEQESVAETGRLFVRNLSYTTSEEDLQELFGRFGELSHVHLVLDKDTKRSKGFAYILYMLPESAVRAMEALDMSTFQGRLLHILPAKRPPSVPEKELRGNMSNSKMSQFKQDREVQRKAAEASGNTQAWNSLFMRPDTIAENVAKRYGLSKSDLLNPEAEDLAVRMALGETQIIAETKKSLADEGINVEVLEELATGKLGKVKRSNRVIIVKNLPFETTETDLVTLFGKYGSLERVVLPPTRTLSTIIYLEASEARAAFKGLAYKRFKHVPLYLEWAPDNILVDKPHKESTTIEKKPILAVGGDQVKRAVLEQELIGPAGDVDSSESRSVFIKNLNFSTSETSLKQHLQKNLKVGSLRSVKIKMKRHKSGKMLSMGFGFAEFDSPETAKVVCKQLQGTVLEGHALVLQLSHMKETPSKAVNLGKSESKEENSAKLIVRNVAFEATKKDLHQLFSPFGQIKSLRLPKKFDGNHRGFAFLEFVTKQEAQNAYNALASTHLYGRHLVIERAKEGESLEELRTRTANQFSEEIEQLNGNARPLKKQKKNFLDDGTRSFGKIAQ